MARDPPSEGNSDNVHKTLTGALKEGLRLQGVQDFMASRGFGVIWADPAGTTKFMAESDTNLGNALKAVGLAK